MARTGRPLALTKERSDRIIGAMTVGSTIDEAAHVAEIDPTTVSDWLSRGKDAIAVEQERGRAKLSVNQRRLADFSREVARARARRRHTLRSRLEEAMRANFVTERIERFNAAGDVIEVKEKSRLDPASIHALLAALKANLPTEFNVAPIQVGPGSEDDVAELQPLSKEVASRPETLKALRKLRNIVTEIEEAR